MKLKCTAKLVKPKKCKLQTKILLGLPGSHLLVFKSTNTNMDKIFETNSCFLVKERTAGKVQLRFFRRYLLVLKKKCLFWRKTIILWSLEIFLIFLNFLRTYFFFLCGQSLLRPPPPPAAFGNSWGNSYIQCLLPTAVLRFTCGKENLVDYAKVSKYYDHGYLKIFILFLCLH